MIIVSDSTPLIALDAINSLDLLSSLYTNIHIPEAVYHEVAIAGAGRTGATVVSAAPWIKCHQVTDRSAVIELQNEWRLHLGETEAIVLAQELHAERVLLDDRIARRVARQRLGLPVVGTIGVLLLAKDANLIPTIRPALDDLLNAGIYLDSNLYREALRLAGE